MTWHYDWDLPYSNYSKIINASKFFYALKILLAQSGVVSCVIQAGLFARAEQV